MKLKNFFERHPVFSHSEFVEFLSCTNSRNAKTRESILRHYEQSGRILRIKRGLYMVVPYGMDAGRCPIDPFLIAGKISEDAILAYHTALEFHGKAYSVFEQFYYLTKRSTRPLLFRSYRFKGVHFPKAVKDTKHELFGVEESERKGIEVRVTGLERTLVDLLNRPELGGGWEEIWRSLESVEYFDLDEVIEYSLLLGVATTIARVGFYLEQHREPLMVETVHLDRLREFKPKNPHYFVRTGRKSGRLIKDWNLIVPDELLERRWQDVY